VNGWADDSHCSFHDGAYHVTGGYACFAPAGLFSDFDMQVTVEETSGPLSYGYGLTFRSSDSQNYYDFAVAADGSVWISRWVNEQRDHISPTWHPPTFMRGLGQPTTLRLVARGSSFTCYVNGVGVGTVSDSSTARGRVGFFSGESTLEAAFSNFEVAGVP
jgi:hypothetical protein